MFSNFKLAALKAFIVRFPSYSAAFLTEKMVYVVPTLVAAGFFASTIGTEDATQRRVDQDHEHDAYKEVET